MSQIIDNDLQDTLQNKVEDEDEDELSDNSMTQYGYKVHEDELHRMKAIELCRSRSTSLVDDPEHRNAFTSNSPRSTPPRNNSSATANESKPNVNDDIAVDDVRRELFGKNNQKYWILY
jgi:hypothetical protein